MYGQVESLASAARIGRTAARAAPPVVITSRVWLRVALASMALVGCRGGASIPRRTSAPSDGGGLVLRNYPLSIGTCLDQCHWVYDRCAGITPECDVFGRLEAAVRSGGAGAYTDLILQEEVRNRADVCLTRCAEPERLCARQCFDAVDAGPPVPQPLRPQ